MDFLEGINTPDIKLFGLNTVFQLLFFVVLVGYVFYAFLLTLRVRILADTVSVKYSKIVKSVTIVHIVVALVGGFLALILILLA
ncbi:hypothetical protein KC622_00810 [Candidatus Dojkabacteria bacterium]|uniref:Uncharacterized protein n=1 Tax=Candidatus Dojkabacteria bacterium TaxID=2099670 RepID=A0A955KWE0_9BACT|nr:hypothetical protein [Candidatus Dojkabacteria bacterium]MCB9791055.1 hypothetical protein [Candidatus Nomurabacteria bacterium]